LLALTNNCHRAELVFIKKERGVIRRDPRPATQVATLLANHGTRHVILNACRSAMDSASTSNFARLLIEKGVSVAIGMSFNILDSAAKIFVRTLYSEYLGNRRSLPESVRIARKALQRNPRRRTRYATEVNIQDHITPVIFCSREMDMPYALDHNVHDEDHPENIDEELIGREASMLDLENIFLLDEDDNIISLHGPPGVGKSAFLHHLSCWWEITGLIRRSILVDVSKHTDWSQVLEHVCQHFNLPYEPSLVGLHKYLEKHRCLLVFDNAGAIECSSGSDRNESAFRKFLLRVENSLVVISSRSDLHAFRDISQVYRLTNLDLRSGIQLMHKILHQNGRETNTGDSQEFIFLEFCVSLVSSHPLAIEIIARDFTRLDIGFQEYYQRLTDGAAISIDSDWVDSNPGARIISEAEAVIQGSNTINPEDLEMADIRLLSPFWHVIPCDFAPYLQFFRWAYERVSSDRWPLDEVTGGLEQWSRLQAQKRNKSRANYMNNREKHVFGFYQPVQDFEPEVWNLQEQYIPYFKRFKSIRLYGDILKGPMQHPPESGPRMFHTVHPIFTLVLRQAKFKLPPWLDHALYVSFNRFYSRRRQHMNDKSGDGLAKEAAIQLIRFEYVNFITYANFTLRLQPTYINFGQFHPNAVVHGISVSPKCHFIYRDVLSRAIETVRAEVTTETTMMSTLRSSLIKGYNTLFGKDLADLWLETKSMHAYFCIASINACIRDGVRVGLPMTDIPLLIDKIESTWRPGSFVPNDNMLQFLQYAKQCLRYVREPNSQDALKQLIDLTKYPVIIHIGSPMIALHDVVLPIYPDGLDLFTPYIQSAISSNRNLVDTFMWAHVLARTASTPLEIAEANRYLQLALEREIHGTNGPLIKVAIFRLMGNLAVKKHEFDLAVQLEAQALAFDVRKDALPHLTPLRIYSDRCAKIEEARRKRNPSYQQPRSITFRGTDSQSVVEPVMQSTAPGTWSTFPRRYAAGVGLSLAFPQARLCGTDSHIDQR
jgi:CHAT domain/NB-ARC domain